MSDTTFKGILEIQATRIEQSWARHCRQIQQDKQLLVSAIASYANNAEGIARQHFIAEVLEFFDNHERMDLFELTDEDIAYIKGLAS